MISFQQGTLIAGRYRLERALAQGGMGCVWVARHLQLDTEVAIKFMTPQFAASADARARFEREARASAQLKLQNAVQVHDYGVEDESPFLVMELLEGEDLEARLRRERRLTIAATLAILDPVCRALRRAHEVGLVHRDLKPGNIFIARQGGDEVVKILDFGIAKDTGASFGGAATRTGAMLGSPQYMSPEQVRSSNRVDLRSDLWSLGVIAFRCLTGQLPFPSDEVGEVLVDVCTAPIPRPSQVAPDLGPEVDRFFERALVRDLGQRFQSAGELIEAFAATAGVRLPISAVGVAPSLPAAQAAPALPLSPAPIGALPSPAPASGTLSPSEHTHNRAAPARGPWIGVVLAALGAALVLGLAAYAFLHARGPTPATAAPAPPAPPAVSASADPIAPTAAAIPAPAASAGAPAATEALAPASSAAPEAAPATTSPGRKTPAKAAPGRPAGNPAAKKGDDILNHI
jgi:serine/threonine protein kinase